jgi:hypothetical protein
MLANKTPQEGYRHIQWDLTMVEELEENWNSEGASDLESDVSEGDEDESKHHEAGFVSNTPNHRRAPSPLTPTPKYLPVKNVGDHADSNFEFNDTKDLGELTLTLY